jgi:hypothetical protein
LQFYSSDVGKSWHPIRRQGITPKMRFVQMKVLGGTMLARQCLNVEDLVDQKTRAYHHDSSNVEDGFTGSVRYAKACGGREVIVVCLQNAEPRKARR